MFEIEKLNRLVDKVLNLAKELHVPLRWRLNQLSHFLGAAVNLEQILGQNLHLRCESLHTYHCNTPSPQHMP